MDETFVSSRSISILDCIVEAEAQMSQLCKKE